MMGYQNRMPIRSSPTLVRPNMRVGMGMIVTPPQFRHPGPGSPMARGPQQQQGHMPTQYNKIPSDVGGPKAQFPPQQARQGPGYPSFGYMMSPPMFVMQPPPGYFENTPFRGAIACARASVPSGVPPPVINVKPVTAVAGMDPKVVANVVAKAHEWSEHISPCGNKYYYNSSTNASTWNKPQALIKFQEMQKSVASTSSKDNKASDKLDESGMDAPKPKPNESKNIAGNKLKLAQGGKCRPISSTAIQGTPWCVVWTGDKKVFFFNPSKKLSMWERPRDLVGRLDVDELIRKCPEEKVKKVEATSTSSPVRIEPDKRNNPVVSAKVEPPETKAGGEMRESEGESDTPTKKQKTDEQTITQVDDDSDSKAAKKEVLPEKKKVDKKLERTNAFEEEEKAAKERAALPLQVRLEKFREMLIEKQVSAFSPWEKELHKIVFDSRYLLLTSKERKAAFDNFVQQRAEEERREKISRMKRVKERFMKFLDQVQTKSYHGMSFNEFCNKYGRDERFTAVERSRDRENYFMEHTSEVKRQEKEERTKEKTKDLFMAFLKDKISDYHLKWADVKKKLETESRFDSLNSEVKKKLFRIHQKQLKADAKAGKKKAKYNEKAKRLREKLRREQYAESISDDIKTGSEKTEDVCMSEEEGCITDTDDEDRKEREKKEKQAASLRQREKQVQRALAAHLEDRDQERERYRHEEAVSQFKALLTDLVKTPDVTWSEAKKGAKQDKRWSLISLLPREEMEELFMHHCRTISRKKIDRYRELLGAAGVKVGSSWKEILKKIKDDPRYIKFSSSERECEREFYLYLKDKSCLMRSDFRLLLTETKMLNHRTKKLIRESPHVMKDIEALLAKDNRYLTMDSMPKERERLLVEYLNDLERRGSPPPPTASNPSKRMKV